MKKTFILLLAAFVVLSALSSCKKSKDAVPPPGPSAGVYVGNIAFNFTETDSQGNPVTLESFRGNVILLTFSTMWCNPCRAETPELVGLYNTYKERGLEIIQFIYQDEDRNSADLNDLARWINEFGTNFIVCNDPDPSTVSRYDPEAIPLNLIIDRDFIIRYRDSGYHPNEVRQWIESLL